MSEKHTIETIHIRRQRGDTVEPLLIPQFRTRSVTVSRNEEDSFGMQIEMVRALLPSLRSLSPFSMLPYLYVHDAAAVVAVLLALASELALCMSDAKSAAPA